MYEGLIAILTAAGIQLTFSWNFHKVYLNLHKEFHPHVRKIVDKRLERVREELNRILVRHTGQPIEKIREDTERDFYMTGERAKRYGIIDEVVSNRAKQGNANE